jgi:UDP-glucose 4-epimerase
MTRVGVTGASGFLGSALVDHLAGVSGIEVVALTRTLPPDARRETRWVSWTQGDLQSPYDTASFVEGLDCVVHLAHKGSPLTSGNDLPGDAMSNLVPMLRLLEAIRDRGGDCHVVYASSGGALYAGRKPGRPATESSPVELTSSYAIQKLAGEQYLRVASEEGWLTATALRIGNAYGVVLPPARLQGFLGVAVARMAAHQPLRLIGDTRNVRDYVHLGDVCAAFGRALEARAPFDVFNIGTGRGTSIDELVTLLGEISGEAPLIERTPPTAAASRLPRWVVLDSSKAHRILGWQPRVPLRAGIERLWQAATQ